MSQTSRRRSLFASLIAGTMAPAFLPFGALAEVIDDQIFTLFQAGALEYRVSDQDDLFVWDDVQGWVGTDYDKLVFKTEGEVVAKDGDLEEAEVQILYSRLISDFWDIQVGGRYDIEPDPERAFGVIGLQGLAPQFFEVEAHLYVSEDADVSARIDAEYELLITQRLILEPSVEMNFAAQEVEDLGIGTGLNDFEVGLRLRYEFIREFAPYIGIVYEKDIGDTADFTEDEGESVDALSFVAGFRVFF